VFSGSRKREEIGRVREREGARGEGKGRREPLPLSAPKMSV